MIRADTTPTEFSLLADRITEGLELPDWYYTLRHNVYENCVRPSRYLEYVLDRRDWLVPRPRLTLCTWRNQLGNLKVAWEPTLDHSFLPPDERAEFSNALLTDCHSGRNELMWIKEPRLGRTADERVRQAATLLCRALVRRHELLVEELEENFFLTRAGSLVVQTTDDGFADGVVVNG